METAMCIEPFLLYHAGNDHSKGQRGVHCVPHTSYARNEAAPVASTCGKSRLMKGNGPGFPLGDAPGLHQ